MSSAYTGVPGNITSPAPDPAVTVPLDGDVNNAAALASLQALVDQSAQYLKALRGLALYNLTLTGLAAVICDVAYNGTVFLASLGNVAASTSHWFTSSDGRTWTTRTGPNSTAACNVIWVSSLTLFVGTGWSGGALVLETSPDGTTWTNRTVPSSTGTSVLYGAGLAFGAGLIVACGNTGQVITSPDGVTWTARTSTFGAKVPTGVVWAGTQFVCVCTDGTVFTSPDGLAWTSRGGTVAAVVTALLYNPRNGVLLVIGTSGAASYSSPDGITWTSRGAPPTSSVGVAFGQFTTYVAPISIFYWYTSPDGVTWTKGIALVPQPPGGAAAAAAVRMVNNDRAFLTSSATSSVLVSLVVPNL